LDLLSRKINKAIEVTDPKFFAAFSQLHEVSKAKHASLTAWSSIDTLLLKGCELLFNHLSGKHKDSQDPRLAYAGLYAAGNFKSGGYLYLHQFNLRVCLLSGDFVLIHGRVLEHEIEAWEGGQ
jgi:hypothetical protein